MDAVIKKEDEEAVCRGCLSTNRRLTPLTNYDLYFVLLDTKELIEDYKYLNILLCWECTALLRRTQIFRQRLQRAQYTLAQDKLFCTSTLSTLKHDHKQDYDCSIEETIELKPNIDQFFINHIEIDIKEDIDNFKTENQLENHDNYGEDKLKKVKRNLRNKKQRNKQDLKKIGNVLSNPEDTDNFETDNHFENYDNSEEGKIKKVKKNAKNKKQREKQDLKKIDNVWKNLEDSDFEIDNPFENYDDSEDDKLKKVTKNKNNKKQREKQDLKKIDNVLKNLEDSDFEIDNPFENYDDSEEDKIKKVTKKKKNKKLRERQDMKKIDNGLDLNNPDKYFSQSCLSEMEIEELLERERDDRDVSRPEKCAICGFRFGSRTEVYDHKRIDHRRRKIAVKCPHCALPYKTHWELDLHCWRSHPVNRCTLCGRVFARERERVKHLEQHKYRYRCVKCDVDFETKQLFSYHQRELHSKYICAHCGTTRATKRSLEYHIVRHHLPNKCPSCPLIFSTWQRMSRHARASHGQPGEETYCVECDISFPNSVKYKRHISHSQKHTPRKKISVPCPECGKVFSRKTYMNSHMNLVHFNHSRHHCQLCGKDYKYLNILLCWECTALLRRMQIFRQRLQRAQYTLAHDKLFCTSTLSTLKHDHKQDYDYSIEETLELKSNIDQFLTNHMEIDIKEDIDNFETENHFENYDNYEEEKLKKVKKNLRNKKQREKQDLKKIDNVLGNPEDIDNFETDNHFENYDNSEEDKIKTFKKNLTNKKQREKQDLKKIDNVLKNPEDIDNFETDNHFENYDNSEEGIVKKVTKNKKNKKQRERQDMKKFDNGLDLNNPDIYFSQSCLSEKEIEELLERERDDRDVSRPQKCAICGFRFASKTELYDHKKNNHRRRSIAVKCPHCALPYKTHWELELHCWRSHPVNRCTLCGRVFARERERVKHLEQHKYRYRCVKCDVDFENKRLFSYHQKQLHSKYLCAHCGHTRVTKKSLENHIVRHHLPNKCPSCPLIFSTWERLSRHARASHGQPGEEAYCVECDVSFPNRAKYKRHLSQAQRHRPRKKISVPCPECGKVFSRKTYMNNHMKLFHSNQSRHHCLLCDKYFVNGFTLRTHNKHVHEKIPMPKTKICSVCGRGFGTNRVLENHMRTHTGERPFACAHCAAAFAQKVALKAHLAAIHKEK